MRVLPSLFNRNAAPKRMTKEERYIWWLETTGGYPVSSDKNREIFERDMRMFGYEEVDGISYGRTDSSSRSQGSPVGISINIKFWR